MCVIISATSSVSCNFDDLDICGYRDLSEAGTNWLQIHNSGDATSSCTYGHVCTIQPSNNDDDDDDDDGKRTISEKG